MNDRDLLPEDIHTASCGPSSPVEWDLCIRDHGHEADRLIALGWTRPDAPPPMTRLVLVTEDADTLFFGRSERGNRLTWEWGEPDEHGWYTPVITEHNDEPLPLDEERLARAIKDTTQGLMRPAPSDDLRPVVYWDGWIAALDAVERGIPDVAKAYREDTDATD